MPTLLLIAIPLLVFGLMLLGLWLFGRGKLE